MGGVGNLLFEIAHAYTYSLRFNKQFELYDSLYQQAHHTDRAQFADNLFANLRFKPAPDVSFDSFYVYCEPSFGYHAIDDIPGNVRFHGHFQSFKYFQSFKTELAQLFNINSSPPVPNTCALHVRRGDYVSLPDHHPLQDLDYYKKAIALVGRANTFHVFSDDIPWCKEHLSALDADFIYSENSTAPQDFNKMLNCESHIIANSTFSWWPAWFVNNRVVAPNKWFGPVYAHYNHLDLLPPEWLTL